MRIIYYLLVLATFISRRIIHIVCDMELVSIKNKSLIPMLNSCEPSMDRCETPYKIYNSLLNTEPILSFCDLPQK